MVSDDLFNPSYPMYVVNLEDDMIGEERDCE